MAQSWPCLAALGGGVHENRDLTESSQRLRIQRDKRDRPYQAYCAMSRGTNREEWSAKRLPSIVKALMGKVRSAGNASRSARHAGNVAGGVMSGFDLCTGTRTEGSETPLPGTPEFPASVPRKHCAMNAVQNTSTLPACEPDGAQATRRAFAEAVVAAAVLYNFVLCFVNTNLFGISAVVVILAEVALIGIAFVLIWDRSSGLLCGPCVHGGLLRRRDRSCAPNSSRNCTRSSHTDCISLPGSDISALVARPIGVVALLIAIAFAVALFEWLAPGVYLRYFESSATTSHAAPSRGSGRQHLCRGLLQRVARFESSDFAALSGRSQSIGDISGRHLRSVTSARLLSPGFCCATASVFALSLQSRSLL